jgi:hypothetical protein
MKERRGSNSVKGRMEALASHPTIKPVALVADAFSTAPRAVTWCSISS